MQLLRSKSQRIFHTKIAVSLDRRSAQTKMPPEGGILQKHSFAVTETFAVTATFWRPFAPRPSSRPYHRATNPVACRI
jgi:hypothetical protein